MELPRLVCQALQTNGQRVNLRLTIEAGEQSSPALDLNAPEFLFQACGL